MADTPGYPDTNPAMFIDPQKRLWLFWPTILANRWETALLKYRISGDYQKGGPPRWGVGEVLHVTPGTNFEKPVNAGLDEPGKPQPPARAREFDKWVQEVRPGGGQALLPPRLDAPRPSLCPRRQAVDRAAVFRRV